MENWKLLLTGIRNALSDLVSKTFNVNGSVEVSNLPDVQKVEILNPQEPTETVKVSNLIDYKPELEKIIGELNKEDKPADYSSIINALKEVVRTLEVDKTDYSPIISAIEDAVKELRVEYPEVDYSEIINTIKGIQQFNLAPYLYDGELPVIINEKQIKKLVDAFGKKAGQIVATSTSNADTSKLAKETTLQTIADTVYTESDSPATNIGILGMTVSTSDYSIQPVRQTANGILVDSWTAYTEGATDASITGVPAMWEDAGNTLVPISAAKPLPVSVSGVATETTLAKLPGLSIPIHDYIALTYTGSNLTGVIFKTGGSGGATVATLTLAYTGSRLDSVTKS